MTHLGVIFEPELHSVSHLRVGDSLAYAKGRLLILQPQRGCRASDVAPAKAFPGLSLASVIEFVPLNPLNKLFRFRCESEQTQNNEYGKAHCPSPLLRQGAL